MAHEKQNPNFFAVIPANVRYAKISPNAKLLFGEITALCSREGYCWASNGYFAEIYNCHRNSVSNWMAELAEAGFIIIKVDKSNGNMRRVYLSQQIVMHAQEDVHLSQQAVQPITNNCDTPITKNCAHSNTNNNNKNNKNTPVVRGKKKKKVKLTMEEWEAINGELNVQMLERWIKTKGFDPQKVERYIEAFKLKMNQNGNEYLDFVSAFQNYINSGYLNVLPEQLKMDGESQLKSETHDYGLRL